MTNSLKTVLLMALMMGLLLFLGDWRLWRRTRFSYGVYILVADELWDVLFPVRLC